ncbi:MAG: GYD domain-containing protein [Burkholderiaceae bacterium]
MVTYIALVNFTDQGIASIKETTKRADAVKEMGKKFGVNMREIFWTLGKYDLVTISEAADEASITAFGLAIGAAGNVRLQSLRAFNKEEMNQILAKITS